MLAFNLSVDPYLFISKGIGVLIGESYPCSLRRNENLDNFFYLIDGERDLNRSILVNFSHYTVRIGTNSISIDTEVL